MRTRTTILLLTRKTKMTNNEVLKQALEEALDERTEVKIKNVAAECGIKHISSNDLRVMVGNLLLNISNTE